jgi:hypothetical protein
MLHTPHQGTSFLGDKSLKALPSREHARVLLEKGARSKGAAPHQEPSALIVPSIPPWLWRRQFTLTP